MKKFAKLRVQMSPQSHARTEAKATALLDQILFEVDADKFKQFVGRLDAPGNANPGLERVMDVRAPWSTAPVLKK